METLARLIHNRTTAWAIVVVTLLLAGVSILQARQVENEDDILAFLPKDNPEVRVFHDINKRFGGLDVALVGIRADDVLTRGFLERLRRVTRELKETKGLDHVLSLSNVIDFTPDPQKGGVTAGLLVDPLPKDAAGEAALRRKVMSRDHVVGNLIATNGKAVLIYCYLAYGTDPKSMAARIQDTVRNGFPDHPVFWGGSPFISTYIYNTTQRDMHRLTPWAVLAIVLIMLVSFRDIIGTFLALLSTSVGIVLSLGLMAFFGVKFNIVLSSMPVILFAIGSAYGIHVLARFYRLSGEVEANDSDPNGTAAARTLTSVGPTVVAAGLTTAAGLMSFIMMDIKPIRTFGLFTALGILFTLLLSLTFIPAVARLVGLRRKPTRSLVLRQAMVRFTVFAAGHRLAVGLVLGAVAAAGLVWAFQIDSRMDQATFFSAGSPPDRAERFLRRHFGGSQFIQVHIEGRMDDPQVLREVQRLADRFSLLPHVTSVLHVGKAVAQVNEVMVGQRRIPDTKAQVKMLFAWLVGDPSVAQLVTADREHALVHVKVGSNLAADLEPLLEQMERITAEQAPTGFRVVQIGDAGAGAQALGRQIELVALRIRSLAGQLLPRPLDRARVEQLERALAAPAPRLASEDVIHGITRFLRSDECAVDLPRPEGAKDPAPVVARALADLGPAPDDETIEKTVARTLGRPADDALVQDLTISVATPLQEIWRTKRAAKRARKALEVAGVSVPDSGPGRRFSAGAATALLDLDMERGVVPATQGKAAGTMSYQVNGLPVMHRGLSRSVEHNQLRSLGFALGLIVLIMALIFRSLRTGLLVAAPTMLTLVVIYGGMGLLGVRLDIGTSLLASLILGAGVDYAVHLTSAWYAPAGTPLVSAAARAADRTGPAIWTNAIMVCAGFLVLATGEARPLQNVGGLTGAAMITAAVATFLLIPVLARRRRYSSTAATLDSVSDSEAVETALRKASHG